jgi:hypothetical protein
MAHIWMPRGGDQLGGEVRPEAVVYTRQSANRIYHRRPGEFCRSLTGRLHGIGLASCDLPYGHLSGPPSDRRWSRMVRIPTSPGRVFPFDT